MTTLGPIGLASSYPYTDDAAVVADEAQRVESLGFSTLWRSGNLPMLDAAVRATTSIPVATGIIPVDSVPAADVIATYRSLQRDHPGRFIVGLGGAHGARPLTDAQRLPRRAGRRGPQRRLSGAGRARAEHAGVGAGPGQRRVSVSGDAVVCDRCAAALGADKTLAVLLMVMPTTDREAARQAAATPLDFLTKVGGYRRNLLRQGFSESDIDDVSDRLLDGITASGDLDSIAARVAEYRAAGADQVVLRILGADDEQAWQGRLAEALIG